MEKSQLLVIISEIKEITNEYNLNQASLKIEKIENELNYQKVLVPLIGKFTTGKSNLINALLEDNILKVGIEAKTAIKHEILRGNNTVLIKENGSLKEISLGDFKMIPENEFGKNIIEARLRVNNQNIPENLVLVDLPGLESGYMKHDEVIDEILPDIHSVIVTVSVNQGGMPESVLRFLTNLRVFNRSVYLLLTMADVHSKDDTMKVKNHCEDQLRDINVKPKMSYITCAGKNHKDIDGFIEILKDISANSEELLESKIKEDLLLSLNLIDAGIKSIKSNSSLSLDDLHAKIKNMNASKYDLEKELNNEISDFKINIRKNAPKLARDMGKYFEDNVNILVDACMKNEDTFINSYNTLMSNSIEFVLLPSLQDILKENLDKFEENLKNISAQISGVDTSMIDYLKTIVQALTGLIKYGKMIKLIKKIKILKKISKIPKGIFDIALILIQDWAINKLTKLYVKNELLKSIRNTLVHKLETEILSIMNEISSEVETLIKESYNERFTTIDESIKEVINQIDTNKSIFAEYLTNLDININKVCVIKSNISGGEK